MIMTQIVIDVCKDYLNLRYPKISLFDWCYNFDTHEQVSV
jgi:hypothetical protein